MLDMKLPRSMPPPDFPRIDHLAGFKIGWEFLGVKVPPEGSLLVVRSSKFPIYGLLRKTKNGYWPVGLWDDQDRALADNVTEHPSTYMYFIVPDLPEHKPKEEA